LSIRRGFRILTPLSIYCPRILRLPLKMEQQYIDILNQLRFSKENNEALLSLRDRYEEELKDDENVKGLIHPRIKCIITDDTELLNIMTDRYFKKTPEIDRDDLQNITHIVSNKYEKIMTGGKRGVSGVKNNTYTVYLRVHPDTGHFYIGHTTRDAYARNKGELYFLTNDITKWTKTANLTLVHEFLRNLIIQGRYSDTFRTSNLISFEDKESAELYESTLVLLVSLNKIPTLKPEMMLNIQYRFNEMFFTYEDSKGNKMCYVNDYPNFYRFVL